MLINACQLRVDQAAKFHHSIRVFGWFHHPRERLASIAVEAPGLLAATHRVGLPHAGVADLGPDKGFSLQMLVAEEGFPAGATLRFTTTAGTTCIATLDQLAAEAGGETATAALMHRFLHEMHALPSARVLDLGGRARSGARRRDLFNVASYTVLDVIADPSVDVVGDAHTMATLFPPESFDGVLSVSVFEHLLMPWTVVTQLNQVLKPGGLALIFSHQTLGMHDMPWDFWRFSDTAWDALFNQHTGFTIVARAMDRPQFLIPHVYHPGKADAEAAAGFEGSCVLARKTGPCRLAWQLSAADVIASRYPAG
jgi:hypothetical protein